MSSINMPLLLRTVALSGSLAVLAACVGQDGGTSTTVAPSPVVNRAIAERGARVMQLPPAHHGALVHPDMAGRAPSYPHGLPPASREAGGAYGPDGRMAPPVALRHGQDSRPVPVYADCNAATLANLQGAALVDYLVTVNGECVNSHLFDATPASWHAFTPESLRLAAERAMPLAERWDGHTASGLWALTVYLKAAYFQQYYHPDKVPAPDAATHARVLEMAGTLLSNPALWSEGAEDGSTQEGWLRNTDAQGVASTAAVLVDSVRDTAATIRLAGAFLQRYDASARGRWAESAVQPIQVALYNLTFSDGFAERVAAGELSAVQAALVRLNDAGPGSFTDALLYRNNLRESSRYLAYPATQAAGEASLSRALLTLPRLSPEWVEVAYDLARIGSVPCERYALCSVSDELSARLFPNSWSFDNGSLVFRTALPRAEVEQLYYAMKMVRSQFMRLTGVTGPVADDPNAHLTMVIYASPDDYHAYQPYLNNLSTNNGGIYIEQTGTFYTYQRRVPQESYLTLEELVRHEYVHYLSGRYLVPGMWGDAPFYRQPDRMTWFDEGLAEFLAWSTVRDGIRVRGHVVGPVAADWPADFREPAAIMQSSYDSGFSFYNHAAMWFYYLNSNEPSKLITLFERVRSGDVDGFDAQVRALGIDPERQERYKAYAGSLVDRYGAGQLDDTSTVLGRDWRQDGDWQLSALDAVDQQLTRVLPLSCSMAASGRASLVKRFECKGTLPLTASRPETARQEMASLLDSRLRLLVSTGSNNFLATTCDSGGYDVSRHQVLVRCEGPLAAH